MSYALLLVLLILIYFVNQSKDSFTYTDRTELLLKIIKGLKLQKGSRVLDLGGKNYYNYFKNTDIEYVMLEIDTPVKYGTGGYNRHPLGMVYNGKDLPFKKNSFDLIIVSFVLHHAGHNTLPLLRQLKEISSKYVIIGEDLSEIDYEQEWHSRNFEHQPGGMYRSDEEWRELFRLYDYKLIKQYPIKRDEDFSRDRIYRMLYLLGT